MAAMHRVDLPGLIGDEPLGFLAAMSLISQMRMTTYLSWDPQDRHAILHSTSLTSVQDIVAVLKKRLAAVKHGEVLPHTEGFPVRRRRGAPDPLRLRPGQYRSLLQSRPGAQSWLSATVTDRATDASGYCLVNPLIAVRGRQTIGSFWYYSLCDVRQDPDRLLTETLTGWRRVEGAEGWLLDHRATYSSDPRLQGPGGSMAVPGATWLATLAIDRFRYPEYPKPSGNQPPMPCGWFQPDSRPVFVWPLWTLPASSNTLHAVWNVGWKTGSWRTGTDGDDGTDVSITRTHGVSAPNGIDYTVDLDIFTMCAAARPIPGGPLTPLPVRTRRYESDWHEYRAWGGWDAPYPVVGSDAHQYGHG